MFCCHCSAELGTVWQAEMYGAIGEEDVLAGLWKRRCRTENTRAGEMLMQVHSSWSMSWKICSATQSVCSVLQTCPCKRHLLGTGDSFVCHARCRWDCFLRRRTCSLTPAASRLHLTHVRILQTHAPW